MPEATKCWKRWEGSSLRALGECSPTDTWISDLKPLRTVEEKISVVLGHPVSGPLSQQTRETDTVVSQRVVKLNLSVYHKFLLRRFINLLVYENGIAIASSRTVLWLLDFATNII